MCNGFFHQYVFYHLHILCQKVKCIIYTWSKKATSFCFESATCTLHWMLLSSCISQRNRNVHFHYAILYFLSSSPFLSSSLFQTKHTCLLHCSLCFPLWNGRYFISLDTLLALFKTSESTKHSIHYASAAGNTFGGMIVFSALKWLGDFFGGFCSVGWVSFFLFIISKHFFLFCFPFALLLQWYPTTFIFQRPSFCMQI